MLTIAFIWSALARGSAAVAVATSGHPPEPASAAESVLSATCDPALASLLREVLEGSPTITVARARADAAAALPGAASALPDAMLMIETATERWEDDWGSTSVEVRATRTMVSPMKRRLAGGAASADADAARAFAEAETLELVELTAAAYYDFAWLGESARVKRDELELVRGFVDVARSRYEVGAGSQADVLRIHAALTRLELDLIEIRARRAETLASLNALRGRPSDEPVAEAELPPMGDPADRSLAVLRDLAMARRPELGAASAAEDAARQRADLARLGRRPDLTWGGFYEVASDRSGASGADEVGLVFGMSFPVRRRVAAAVEEAEAMHRAAAAERRVEAVAAERRLGETLARVRESRNASRLQEEVLVVQADESLRSSLAGYTTGLVSALEVLEAERLTFEVRLMALRARADHAAALVALRAAVGSALPGERPCPAAVASVSSAAPTLASRWVQP